MYRVTRWHPAVLADPSRGSTGDKSGSGPGMEESENDVGSLEQLLLYADEHYLAGKLPLGDHLERECTERTLGFKIASARSLKLFVEQFLRLRLARIVERVTVELTSACRTFLSPRGLPGRSRPGFPRAGTFSCPLLPTISNGTLRTMHLASNTACRPACSFHPDDQALSQTRLTVRNVF
ncbi:uncharacterized protein TNCV_4267251 [Trichonephila clavipes]|nr:uncharacterized protein TNCV_4267251 [Trichonephila clavipes]